MKTNTYKNLMTLHGCFGDREFGKVCQKLLALAYCEAGFAVVERGVQGVDIDAVRGGERYTTEIKTTTKTEVTFATKDQRSLDDRRRDGYQPILGVLRLAPLADWFLVNSSALEPSVYLIDSLRPYRLLGLEDELRPHFDAVVEHRFQQTLCNGQKFLDSCLRGIAADVISART
jgi:hypothetical protein